MVTANKNAEFKVPAQSEKSHYFFKVKKAMIDEETGGINILEDRVISINQNQYESFFMPDGVNQYQKFLKDKYKANVELIHDPTLSTAE